MLEAMQRIAKARKLMEQLSESGYVGNIGIMELVKFQQKASPEQKKMLKSLIDRKKAIEAWQLVQDVTGVKLHKSIHEAVYRGDWVRHPDNPWKIGQIQNIKNDHAEVMWKKVDKRKKAVTTTHHVKDLQHARSEFSQLNQPTHHKEMVSPDILPVSGAGQWGTDKLRQNYQRNTPGQTVTRFKDYTKHK